MSTNHKVSSIPLENDCFSHTGPAECWWVVWSWGAVSGSWCWLAGLLQLWRLRILSLRRTLSESAAVCRHTRQLWWYVGEYNWSLITVANILHTLCWDAVWRVYIFFQVSLEFVPEGLIDMSALVQIMSWGQTGDRPLPEPMMTKFYDVMWHHLDIMR